MNSDDIVIKSLKRSQQREPIKVIEESESYLTTFKGVQGFLFNVCKNLGEDRPSNLWGLLTFLESISDL